MFRSRYRVHLHAENVRECRSVSVRKCTSVYGGAVSSVSGGPWDGVSVCECVVVNLCT